jgi:hypothetical protein
LNDPAEQGKPLADGTLPFKNQSLHHMTAIMKTEDPGLFAKIEPLVRTAGRKCECMSPVKCVNRTWLSTGCAPCIRRGPEPPEAAQQYRRSAQRNQPAARTAGGISATSLRVSFASDSALK